MTTGNLAAGAVTSAKILDGTIVTVDLGPNVVTSAKLADDIAVNSIYKIYDNITMDNVVVSENLRVGDDATIADTLTVTGATALGSTLTVTGDSTLASTLRVENIRKYAVTDNIKVLDNLQVENLYVRGTLGPTTIFARTFRENFLMPVVAGANIHTTTRDMAGAGFTARPIVVVTVDNMIVIPAGARLVAFVDSIISTSVQVSLDNSGGPLLTSTAINIELIAIQP